ncbi:MAG: SDR family NAD(P)-dependent oxidoreductase [Ruminococcaceae bacterium]|nr:SDR family NAD(P)-dependent oxidoreductase [Oscillospiraceae bacterium]
MKKALITGASSGIGKDMAIILSDMGYELFLAARREDKLIELRNSLKTKAKVIPVDLSKDGAAEFLFERVRNEQIDLVINNAGFGTFGDFVEIPLEKELEMIDLNIKALHILTKLFSKKENVRILNVASSAAFMPGPLLATYYATKAYVLRLSLAVNQELKRNNSSTSICVLCPGPVKTEFDAVAGVSFSLKGLSSRYVAKYALKKTLKGKRGKKVIVPGITMKLGRFAIRFLPDCILLKVAYFIQKRKAK